MHNTVGELKMQREQSTSLRLTLKLQGEQETLNSMLSVDTITFLLTGLGIIEGSSLDPISDASTWQKLRNNRSKNNELLKY